MWSFRNAAKCHESISLVLPCQFSCRLPGLCRLVGVCPVRGVRLADVSVPPVHLPADRLRCDGRVFSAWGAARATQRRALGLCCGSMAGGSVRDGRGSAADRKSTRLNSSHHSISYAVFCLKKKKKKK